jgi:hypothetical protein
MSHESGQLSYGLNQLEPGSAPLADLDRFALAEIRIGGHARESLMRFCSRLDLTAAKCMSRKPT